MTDPRTAPDEKLVRERVLEVDPAKAIRSEMRELGAQIQTLCDKMADALMLDAPEDRESAAAEIRELGIAIMTDGKMKERAAR